MEIGRALKYYRALHHLTQSDVAALSGINEKYLGRIQIWPTLTPMIYGAQNVTVSMILKMAISKNLLFIRVQFHNAQTKRTAPSEQSFCNFSAAYSGLENLTGSGFWRDPGLFWNDMHFLARFN